MLIVYTQTTYAYDDRKDDYYVVLGVSQSAKPHEIRKAYLSLAKLMHPDKRINHACAHDDFIRIRTAYDILSNEENRMEYDKTLSLTPMCSFFPQFIYDVCSFYTQ